MSAVIRAGIALAALALTACESLLGITPIVPADAAPPQCGPVGYTAIDLGRIETPRPPLYVLDINGDARPDVLWQTPGGGMSTTTMLLNSTAAGATTPTFTSSQLSQLGTIQFGLFVDLNNDGKPDYVQQGVPASVYLNTTPTMTGVPMPAFALPAMNPTVDLGLSGGAPGVISAVDIDADGKLDIIGLSGNIAHVVLNRTAMNAASPTFVPKVDVPVAPAGNTIQRLAAGDINGDGKLDLVALSADAGNTTRVLTVTLNTSTTTASFAGMVNIPTPVLFAQASFAIGDLDGDGLADLVIGVRGPDTLLGLELLRSTARTGPPRFTEVPFDGNDMPSLLRDLDGDRKLDMVLASSFVFLRMNTTKMAGTPTFQLAPGVEIDTPAFEVYASADVNRDSKPDLLAISTNADNRSSQVALLLSGPSNCPP